MAPTSDLQRNLPTARSTSSYKVETEAAGERFGGIRASVGNTSDKGPASFGGALQSTVKNDTTSTSLRDSCITKASASFDEVLKTTNTSKSSTPAIMTHVAQARKGGPNAEKTQGAEVERSSGTTITTEGLELAGRMTDNSQGLAAGLEEGDLVATIFGEEVKSADSNTVPIDSLEVAEMQPQEVGEHLKQEVGEHLFPLIRGMLEGAAGSERNLITDQLVGKITGMLLELSTDELGVLKSSATALQAKVSEAVDVLSLHHVNKESLLEATTDRTASACQAASEPSASSERPSRAETLKSVERQVSIGRKTSLLETTTDPAPHEPGAKTLRPFGRGRGVRISQTTSSDSASKGVGHWGHPIVGRGRGDNAQLNEYRNVKLNELKFLLRSQPLQDTGRFQDITEDLPKTATIAIFDACAGSPAAAEERQHEGGSENSGRIAPECEGQLCDWCGIQSKCLLFVPYTGRYMCNIFREGASNTCIIRHLTQQGTSRVQARWLLPTQEGLLRCTYTGASNVFALGVVRWDAESSFIVSRATSALLPGLEWKPLVQRGGRRGIEGMLETLFDTDKKAEDTDATARSERRVLLASETPTTYTFEGVTTYVKHFRNLLALAYKYEYTRNDVHEHEGVTIQWVRGDIGEPVALFQLATRSGDKLEVGNHVIIKQEVGDLLLRGWVMWCEVTHDAMKCGVTVLAGLKGEQLEELPTLQYIVTKEQVSISIDRMQSALNYFEYDRFTGPGPHLLAEWLRPGGAPKAEWDSVKTKVDGNSLNEAQKAAVKLAMEATLAIIEGPPGTGKTHVASRIIKQWATGGQGCILVCTASNGAASHIAIELDRIGVQNVLRYFPASKESQDWRKGVPTHLLLESSVPASSELGKYLKLQRTFRLAHPQMQRLKKLERTHYKSELRKKLVIVCTCGAAGDSLIGALRFRYLLIDEAAQATEPDVVVPLTLGIQQCVLVGDPQQLRPLVQCPLARRGGLEISALERLQKAGAPCVMLNTQYRMHPSISSFPSSQFYGGKLQDGPHTSQRHRAEVDFPWVVDSKTNSVASFLFWHLCTPATGGEVREQSTGSFYNGAEVDAVVKVVQRLARSGVKAGEIAVITMYDAQRVQLVRALHMEGQEELLIGNVDAVQGKERPYVIVSLVRSNATHKIGFVDDVRRANVALTRAQAGLVIVGDAYTLRTHEPWRSLLEDCSQRGLLVRGSTLESLVVFALEHTGSTVASFAAFETQAMDEERTCLLPGAEHKWLTARVEGAKDKSTSPPLSRRCNCMSCADERQKRGKSRSSNRGGQTRGSVPRMVGAPSGTPVLREQVRALVTAMSSESWVVKDPEFGYNSEASLAEPTEGEQEITEVEGSGVSRLSAEQRRALASIRLFQYWWRARITGYLTAKQTLIYWRLASSGQEAAYSELLELTSAQSFKANSLLRLQYGVELEMVGLGTRTDAVRRLQSKCWRFRLVRRVLCGYGALACSRLSIKEGLQLRVRDMATQGDFLKQQTVARRVIGWSALYCRALLKRTPNSTFVMSFFAPGLLAEAVRQLGFRVIGIDRGDNLRAACKWFNEIVPVLYHTSPRVICVDGDARDPGIREVAVADHMDGGTVVAQFDTVAGDGAQAGIQEVVSLASARYHQGENDLSKEGRNSVIPFLVKDVGDSGLQESALIRCTTTTGLELGHPVPDRHRWYGPSDLPFYKDAVLGVGDALSKGGAWLRTHSCNGAARAFQPRQPHGVPITPACCPGQTVSLKEREFELYDKRTLCELLRVHPDHLASKTQLIDAVPLLQGLHAGALLGSWAAQIRLSLPLCSYSAACRDPRLGAWVHALLQHCEEAQVQHFLPIKEAIVVILPSHLSGQVMIQGGDAKEVPSLLTVPIATRGDFLEGIVEGLANLHGIRVEASRLQFVSDLGGGSASTRSSRVVMFAEVMTGTTAEQVKKVSLNEQGQFKEKVTGRVSTKFVDYMTVLQRVLESQQDDAAENIRWCLTALLQTLPLARGQQIFPDKWKVLGEELRNRTAVIVLSEAQIAAVHDELLSGEGFQSPLHDGMWRHKSGPREPTGKELTPLNNKVEANELRLKSVLPKAAFEMLERSKPSGTANAVLSAENTEERQSAYRKACLESGIHVTGVGADSKVNGPERPPQPLTIRCEIALLVGRDMVVLYQRAGGSYQPMSAPKLRLHPTAGKKSEDEFLIRGICDALQPWLSPYTAIDGVWDAVDRAVSSGKSEVGQLIVTARDGRGLLPSRLVPGRRIEGTFRRINLPPSFAWILRTTAAAAAGPTQLSPVSFGSGEKGTLYSLTFEQARSFFSNSEADGMTGALARLIPQRSNSVAAQAFAAETRKRRGEERGESASDSSETETEDEVDSRQQPIDKTGTGVEEPWTRMLQQAEREKEQGAITLRALREGGDDYSTRAALELYLEPTLFEQMRQGLKQVEARRINKDHMRVSKGWLLRCRLDARSPCFWVEVVEARRFATFTKAYEHYGTLLLPTGAEVVQQRGSVGVDYEFYKLHVKGRQDTPQRWRQSSGTPGSIVCWKVSVLPTGAVVPAAYMFLHKGRGALDAGPVFQRWAEKSRTQEVLVSSQQGHQLPKVCEVAAVLKRWASRLRMLPRKLKLERWRHGGQAQVERAAARPLLEFFRRTEKGRRTSIARQTSERMRREQTSTQQLRQLCDKVWLRARLQDPAELTSRYDS